MDYKLSELIDVERVHKLMESFTEITGGFVTAILDLEGNILVATGWKDICTKFHRIHPETSRRCTESDTALAGQLHAGQTYNVYKCLNGMVDVAVPIMVQGIHVGNFFTGQFFFEPPDMEFFRKQAVQYGFDEHTYLQALSEVPVFTEQQIKRMMAFLSEFVAFVGEMGLNRLTMLKTETETQHLIIEMIKAADQVTSQSQELSARSEQMASSAEEQAAASEEVSAAMEQMAANIRQNAENALQTEHISVQATQNAKKTNKAVAKTAKAIKKITKKIMEIQEIAAQTRLLSLNATIEAAKAQDYGKGFAVVATEVRSLADRSRTAAEEMTKLANSGVVISKKAGDRLSSLLSDIHQTTTFVQNMSAACHEQNLGAEHINLAIQQLDLVNQQNSTMSANLAATAEILSDQAAQLQNTTKVFKDQKEIQNILKVDAPHKQNVVNPTLHGHDEKFQYDFDEKDFERY